MDELIVMVAPKLYYKILTYIRKGVALLYVKMYKLLYILLKSDLLFYKKLLEDLGEYGFNINPYDKCVANNMVNVKKMTVTWNVYDLKVSHQDAFEITKFATYLSVIYGNNLTVHRE